MRSRQAARNGGPGGRGATPPRPGGDEERPGGRFGQNLRRTFARLTPALILLAGYVLIAALMLQLPRREMAAVEVGKPSPARIVAPNNLLIPDHERTEALRREAAEKVIPVLNSEDLADDEALRRIDLFFGAAQTVADASEPIHSERLAKLAEATGLPLQGNEQTLEQLLTYSRYQLLQTALKEDLTLLFGDGIVSSAEDKQMILQHRQKGVYVVDAQGEMALRAGVESIRTLEEAREHLQKQIGIQFNKPVEDAGPRLLAVALGNLVLTSNLTPNEPVWMQRRQEAANEITPVQAMIQKNQKIIDEGEIVPPRLEVLTSSGRAVQVDSQVLLTAVFDSGRQILWSHLLARALILAVPLLLWGSYIRRYHRTVWRNPVNLSCLLGIVVLIVAMGQLSAYLGVRLLNGENDIGYAVPVALAGLLTTLLLDAQLSFFTVFLLSIYSGILYEDLGMTVVSLTCGLVATFSTTGLRRRMDISWTGAKVALAGSAVALLFYFMRSDPLLSAQSSDANPWGLIVVSCVAHGVLTVMLSGFLLPMLENLMGVVTDIQLLELSQRNNILRRLEAEAPGTYQHSMNVANLAESAADAVGAKGLLARVAALYHDIGKLTKPSYFSENQIRDSDKRSHDRLSPSMSRLLIINHIKDGLELAEKERLPQFVQEAIAQHHGTTLLTYFYDKALREDSKDVVNEQDYRYPGPKPQSVEMAILMLADSLEAASRSLPLGLSQGDLYQFVRRIINQKFVDNQFEYCDLTLSDLHRLADAFSRSLVSILHRRVAYPTAPGSGSGEDEEPSAVSKNRLREQAEEIPVGAAAGVDSASD